MCIYVYLIKCRARRRIEVNATHHGEAYRGTVASSTIILRPVKSEMSGHYVLYFVFQTHNITCYLRSTMSRAMRDCSSKRKEKRGLLATLLRSETHLFSNHWLGRELLINSLDTRQHCMHAKKHRAFVVLTRKKNTTTSAATSDRDGVTSCSRCRPRPPGDCRIRTSDVLDVARMRRRVPRDEAGSELDCRRDT